MAKTERKIILFTRHGEAPQKPEGGSEDRLKPEAFLQLYNKIGVPLQGELEEYEIQPGRTLLTHTKKIRTAHTGGTILVGAYDMQPSEGSNPPKSAEDLKNYDFSKVKVTADNRLMYGSPEFKCDDVNLAIYKDHGAKPGIDFWLANPDATEHDGELIVAGAVAFADTLDSAQEAVRSVINKDAKYDFVLKAGHCPRIEAVSIPIIQSGRIPKIKSIDDIGGVCPMGQGTKLTIDMKNGDVVNATAKYNNEVYKVDITELLNATPNEL